MYVYVHAYKYVGTYLTYGEGMKNKTLIYAACAR